MKFRISRTSDVNRSKKPCSDAYWDDVVHSWCIRVRGLPTLLGLMKKEDHPIILTLCGPDTPTLEIYDDYRDG